MTGTVYLLHFDQPYKHARPFERGPLAEDPWAARQMTGAQS